MAPHRVLILGSGGREHALAWRIARDLDTTEVILAPGNDGAGREFRCLPVNPLDAPALVSACRAERADLVVVGPETPLAAGITDALVEAGILVFGPSASAARLESSKWFAKEIMRGAGIPTARAEAFGSLGPARAALDRFGPPYVVKADGLAAGKGVRVTRERDEAEAFLADCLEGDRFGPGGRAVVIEEFLEGEEASVMAVCDGRDFLLLPPARDYKRAQDGDLGPNTGGMGAYAPSERVDASLEEEVGRRVLTPVLAAMRERGTPFRGVLYCGLVVSSGHFHVLEFNCRFGDPETQAVMPLVEGDLGRLLAGAARGSLDPGLVRRGSGSVVAVALVDEGYPDRVAGRGRIEGLEEVAGHPGVWVFYAGATQERGGLGIRGGRAAYVAARDASRSGARRLVYDSLASLRGGGWRHRSDIGAPVQHEPRAGGREVPASRGT